MKKNTYKGKFIVFEGLDGSGKSTQAGLSLSYLRNKKIKAHLTSEPTRYLIGGLIKSFVTHDWKSTPECLQLLFAADRAHHLDKEIIPFLKKGVTVISDRYFLSSLAFGALEVKDGDWLTDINQKFISPDLTIILKVKPRSCVRRMAGERFSLSLFEKEKKLKKVWRNYQSLQKRFKNVYIVQGEGPVEEIFSRVKALLHAKLHF
jgi:dTMP kinase